MASGQRPARPGPGATTMAGKKKDKKAAKKARKAEKKAARKAAKLARKEAREKAPVRRAAKRVVRGKPAAPARPVRQRPESLRLRSASPSFTVNDIGTSLAF